MHLHTREASLPAEYISEEASYGNGESKVPNDSITKALLVAVPVEGEREREREIEGDSMRSSRPRSYSRCDVIRNE